MHAVTDLLHTMLSALQARRYSSRTRLTIVYALALCFCLCPSATPPFAATQKTTAAKKQEQKKIPTERQPNAASRKSARINKAQSRQYDVKSAITIDLARKRILYEQNADRLIPPASLAKVLTMFVILDRVKRGKNSLNEMVTVSAKAAGTGGSHMGLLPGAKLLLRDLMKGMAVASGNDAAVAAAQHVAGSETAFVKLMNLKAKQLGMRNSLFKNVHGLPAKGQYTTARDMLTMTTHYLHAHPETLTLFHTQRYLAYRGHIPNTNPLLDMDGVDGLKTGYVDASGYNLITTARRGNTRLVNVLLGAPSKGIRLQEATRMMENGFAIAALRVGKGEETVKTKASRVKTRKKKSVAAASTTNTATRQPQTGKPKKNPAAQYATGKVSPEHGGG